MAAGRKRLASVARGVFVARVTPPSIPDASTIAQGRAALARVDPAMAALDGRIAAFGWRTRAPGFAGLVRMILGQQVSTIAADAMWARLEATTGEVTPEAILRLDDATMRVCGLSGQKTRYARALAEAHAAGAIDFDALRTLDDATALNMLIALKGVGSWTGEVYLMMAEGRLDAFPAGDIAVQEAIRWLDGLAARPAVEPTYARAEVWRPWRAVAAHLLWEWYVGVKAGVLAPPVLGRALALTPEPPA